ncbi:inositol monophosphatase family protein [Thermodesulfobacteriota bacterium]
MANLKNHGIEDLTQFALDAIHRLGEEALSFYGKGKSQVKFDEGLVTEVDFQLTKSFQSQLDAHYPEHSIFNGSQERTDDYTHDGKRYLWIYDPLDGIANFQAGIPIWGISLALHENFWPILGVFYMPSTGDLFHARAGHKAFRGKEEIRVSAQEEINNESLLLTYSRFHQQYQSTFPGKIRNMGCTAAHICYVAMGRAEAAIIANESYQDLAAAGVIIESAGGKILKMDGSNFYLSDFLDSQRIGDHLLVVSQETYPQVRGALKEIA